MTEEDNNNEQKNSELDALISKANGAIEQLTTQLAESSTSSQQAQTASTEAQSFSGGAKKALNEIEAALTQVKTTRDEVLAYLEKTKTDSVKTAEIARTADEKDTRVDEYENELEDLREKYLKLESDIKELLPAATGVGLAKSFNTRRKSLNNSLRGYLALYIISIIGFFALGGWALASDEIKSLSDFVTFALERSPLIVGLVLLEELSRRQFRTAVRLEEDYAYKETISIAFDGYKKAMSEMDEGTAGTLASLLGNNVLAVLNQRPGDLIDIEKDNKLSANQILNTLTASGASNQNANALSDLLKNIKVGWLKSASIILIALLIGISIGYYLSGNTPNGVDVQMNLNTTNAKQEKIPNKQVKSDAQ